MLETRLVAMEVFSVCEARAGRGVAKRQTAATEAARKASRRGNISISLRRLAEPVRLGGRWLQGERGEQFLFLAADFLAGGRLLEGRGLALDRLFDLAAGGGQ